MIAVDTSSWIAYLGGANAPDVALVDRALHRLRPRPGTAMTVEAPARPDQPGVRHGGVSVLVNIDVPDLARAERFYCAAFGLTVGRRLGGGALELIGAQAPIWLLEQPAGSRAAANRRSITSDMRHVPMR